MIKFKTNNCQSPEDKIFNVLRSINKHIIKEKLDYYGIIDDEYSNIPKIVNGHISENIVSTTNNKEGQKKFKDINQFKEKLKIKFDVQT
jgi:hypothetical protein